MKIGDIAGIWNIEEMELWDKDYFNMETQAFIKFDKNYKGEFQFGLVRGTFYGRIYKHENKEERLEFTWGGSDETDEAFGFGWIKREGQGRLTGEIRFHEGDDSKFEAVKKD